MIKGLHDAGLVEEGNVFCKFYMNRRSFLVVLGIKEVGLLVIVVQNVEDSDYQSHSDPHEQVGENDAEYGYDEGHELGFSLLVNLLDQGGLRQLISHQQKNCSRLIHWLFPHRIVIMAV